MSFSIKYGSTVLTNKIAEIGERFCRKLSVNKNFLRTKNVEETMGEIALTKQNLKTFSLPISGKNVVK